MTPIDKHKEELISEWIDSRHPYPNDIENYDFEVRKVDLYFKHENLELDEQTLKEESVFLIDWVQKDIDELFEITHREVEEELLDEIVMTSECGGDCGKNPDEPKPCGCKRNRKKDSRLLYLALATGFLLLIHGKRYFEAFVFGIAFLYFRQPELSLRKYF